MPANMSRATLAKAAGVVAFLTVVSKVLGFIREASLAKVFGATSATDAYLVAQTIPYLLFATISYALTTAFVPVYSQLRVEQGEEAGFHFANQMMWAVLLPALVLLLAGELMAEFLVGLVAPGFGGPVAELTAYLSRIIFPVVVFQSLSGVITGVLQVHGKFAIVAASSLAQNVAIIAATLLFGRRYGIVAVAVGALLGSGLMTAAKLPALKRTGFRCQRLFDIHDPSLRRMGILMLPAILGAGAGQLNTLVDRILASGLPEGRVAALSYADRLMQLTLGVLGAPIVTVIYPALAKVAARRDWRAFSESLANALSLVYFLLMPAAVGMLVLREPVVRIVYQRGVFDAVATQETAWALLFLSLGTATFKMNDLVNSAFFAIQDTTTPVLLGILTVATNVVLNLLLVGPLEQGGLALATVLASVVGLTAGLLALERRLPTGLGARHLLSSAFRTTTTSTIMGGVVWFAYPHIERMLPASGTMLELMRVLSASAVGAVVYVSLAWVMRVSELVMIADIALAAVQKLARRGTRTKCSAK